MPEPLIELLGSDFDLGPDLHVRLDRFGADDESAAAACSELARAVVAAGVAPCAAVGWAYRRAGGGWETCTGEAAFASTASPTSMGSTGGAWGVPRRRDGEAIFDLASVTKPMTSLATARSTLDRRAPLGAVLDEAHGTASEGVPVEAFLAHRAGLEAHVLLETSFVRGGRALRREAVRWACGARRADALGPWPPDGFPPVYSDLGYWLAGEALARRHGARDAAEVVEQLVVAPLGLGDALGSARSLAARGIGFDERVVPTEVHPVLGELRGVVHDENARAFGGRGGEGHAGMFGTISAVLAFGGAAHDAIERHEGPLAAAERPAWLVAPRPGGTLRAGFDGKSEEGSSAGAHMSARAYGHLGFTGTSVWIDPDEAIVVALLTNRVHPTRDNVAIRAARPRVHDALFAMASRARGAREGRP